MKSLSNKLPQFFTVILMLGLLMNTAHSQNIQDRAAMEKVDIQSDLAHSGDAQKFASEAALQFSVNSHLLDAGMFSESPIPQGEIFTVSFTELKEVLTPYKGQTEELRKALFEISEARNKAILDGSSTIQNK